MYLILSKNNASNRFVEDLECLGGNPKMDTGPGEVEERKNELMC